MTETKRYQANPDVVLREDNPDGLLLFNPDTNDLRVLNATSLLVWKLCDGYHDLPALVAALVAEFAQVPQDEVAGDVTALLDDMVQAGFVRTVVE